MSSTSSPQASPPAKRPKVEQRRAVRHLCRRECSARPEGAPGVGDWSGMIYNISHLGIGLALVFPVCPGTVLDVQPLGRGRLPRIRARVVRSVRQAFVWFHGCELLHPLGEDELEAWLA
jgi:hypothetical protein